MAFRGRKQFAVEDVEVIVRVVPVGVVRRRLQDFKDLSDDRFQEFARVGSSRDLAVGNAHQCTEGIQGAVVEHLGPEVAIDRSRDFGGDSTLRQGLTEGLKD